MRAMIFTRYGGPEVLELRDLPTPRPARGEVRVRVHAVSINDWDWGAMHGTPFVNKLTFGWPRPRKQILGSDVAGVVEAVGSGVSEFAPGDAVYGDLSGRWGGFAEHVAAPVKMLRSMPAGISYEQAAALPQAGLLALQAIDLGGGITADSSVLFNGAGGGVGTIGIQLARLAGAAITAVDSAGKHAMLRELGTERVVDYTTQDFTEDDARYDLIVDAKTNRAAGRYLRVLKSGGTYVTVGGESGPLLEVTTLGRLRARLAGKRVRMLMLKPNAGLERLGELCAAGRLRPIVEKTYPLEALPEAMRHFGSGRHLGKLVIVFDV